MDTTAVYEQALARERAQVMLKLIREGRTLQSVGDLYGISRERVRQLLTKHCPDYTGRKRKA